jgi:superfamily II DNA or RNA helicase
VPGLPVTVLAVQHHGKDVIEITFKDESGRPGTRLCYRGDESQFELVDKGRAWAFDGDGALLRLVSEARRIQLAHLFDPHLAVHTSLVQPLPHQITAVYGAMLPRQPLRFLLADDPGAGKTIMAGLLIKELLIRGDLKRCLVVCPGNLVEQWQDELSSRFQLPFDILTNDRLESARTGNAFSEIPLLISRLDKLSRDEDAQAKLAQTEWDLIICDESHKMSASFFGGEVKETKRYKLGRLLGGITRHLLLMTATPHNGKEEDFQLFMALLDADRFEGKFRDGAHTADVTDLMRRMVKEQLVKFDGTPLFPERRAYTVNYKLSEGEEALYHAVTDYVRNEFNRVEALQNEGRKGTVGFALTILQRRLASSPEAIYQSLKRRRERLEKRLREEELLRRGAAVGDTLAAAKADEITEIDDIDDAPDAEVEQIEEAVVDSATAAQTIAELKTEIAGLTGLEASALKVRNSDTDRKWDELRKLLLDEAEMFDATGSRRKLIIFTEHRDTLNYLLHRIRIVLGRPEAVITIHGGIGREERKKADPSAYPGGRFILLLPDWLERAHDKAGVHGLHRKMAEDRAAVRRQSVLPLLGVLLVRPSAAVRLDVSVRTLVKGDRARIRQIARGPLAVAGAEWINMLREQVSALGCLVAGLLQIHRVDGAQPHLPRLATERVPKQPRLSPGRTNLKVQTATIGVATLGLLVGNRNRGQALDSACHSKPQSTGATHISTHIVG